MERRGRKINLEEVDKKKVKEGEKEEEDEQDDW